MALEIPGAPYGGGELAAYLSDYEGEIGWMPPTPDPERLLESISELDRNDPASWVAFAGASLQTIWDALPAEVRSEVWDALQDLVDRAIAEVPDIVANAVASAASDAAEAIPFIGAIIKALVIVIKSIVDVHENFESQRDQTSSQWKWAARYDTVRQDHPDEMVFKTTYVRNYLDYRSPRWYLRPCFGRSSGNANLMLVPSPGPKDTGSGCKDGVRMDCPGGAAGGFFDEEDCDFHDKDAKPCDRSLGLSSLFYPFWSPAYPDVRSIGGSEGLSPDQLMIEQQFALLSSPSVNLRVNADRLLEIRDRFVDHFFGQSKMAAPPGAEFGLVKVNAKGIAPGTAVKDRLTIAPEREEDYAPYADRPDKFYLDEFGLIHAYPGADASLDSWGVRATRGPQTPKMAAVTAAQYNAVVSSTLAFMSARSNFLRQGPIMKALLHDFDPYDFDPNVIAAMQYAADVGGSMPMPTWVPGRKGDDAKPKRVERLPERIGKVKPKRLKKRRGRRGGGAVAVLAALALGYAATRKK